MSIGWISVKNRVPETGFKNQVLICTTRRTFHDNRVLIGWLEEYNNWCSAQAHDEEILFVTHWMPLPEPPKEQ